MMTGKILDLHCVDEDPDMGISPGGVWLDNIAEVEKEIAAVKDTVKKINLENQYGCTEVPKILLECPVLEELNLLYTPIKKIPSFVFSLPRLVSLKYNCYELEKQPDFSSAQNLKILEIGLKKGQEIPPEIFSLTNLRSLSINGHEEITGLSTEIGNLENLRELKIKGTHIFALPGEAGKLRRLKKLLMGFYFSGDHPLDLDALAETLAPCALEDLELRNYALHGRFTKLSLLPLKRLYLEYINPGTPDGEILDTVCKLSALEELYLFGSSLGIKKLPDEIGNLQNLKKLSVVGNVFRDIPSSLYSLAKLEHLDLGGCGIKEFGEEAANFTKLRTLILDDNMLETLPAFLRSARAPGNLKTLDVCCNNFSENYVKEIRQALKAALPRLKFHAEYQKQQMDLKKNQALSPAGIRKESAKKPLKQNKGICPF
jgi:Leucine-rich repeat (LRR) protein